MRLISKGDERFREIAVMTLEWMIDKPEEAAAWLKENTHQIDTPFGKLTLMSNKFLREGEMIVK
jgi:hypothetical protein